jgi:hypothetical protein
MPSTTFWKCPVCKKEFAKKNQSHKCEVVDIKDLFRHHDPALFALYKHFLVSLRSVGKFTVTTSKKAITLYSSSRKAFLGINVRRQCLDIWFLLETKTEEFPVYKVVQPSKTKFGHFVRLYSTSDVDTLLIKWIGQSYKLTLPQANTKN